MSVTGVEMMMEVMVIFQILFCCVELFLSAGILGGLGR